MGAKRTYSEKRKLTSRLKKKSKQAAFFPPICNRHSYSLPVLPFFSSLFNSAIAIATTPNSGLPISPPKTAHFSAGLDALLPMARGFIRIFFLLLIDAVFLAHFGPAEAVKSGFQVLQVKKNSEERNGESSRAPKSFLLLHRDGIASRNRSVTEAMLEIMDRDEKRIVQMMKRVDTAMNRSSLLQSKGDFSGPLVSGLSVGSGEYFIRLGIGTPAKRSYMVMDTGSDVPWIQCMPCKSCYKQSDAVYAPRKSSSYAAVPCGATQCKLLEGSECRQSKCVYEVSYGDGSFSSGDLATETISFDGFTASPIRNVAFGCGHDNEGLFTAAAGLLGMGAGKLSFPTQSGALFGSKFSYCLVSRNAGSKASSSLIFGSAAFPRGSTFTPLLKNPKLDTFYYAPLSGISVAGKLLSIPKDVFKLADSGSGGVIIDSGTAVTRLPNSVYAALKSAFKSGTAHLRPANSFSLFDTCFDLSTVSSVEIPSVAFHFANAAQLQLPPDNYMVQVDSSGTFCFAFAKTSMPLSIIGNIQQQTIRIGFDLKYSRIGFSLHQCS